MVIEDEIAWAETIKSALQKGGYEVYHFETAEEALKHLDTVKPYVVVQDYHLTTEPGSNQMNGLESMIAIKQRMPSVRVIFFSAQTSLETALDALKNGAYHYIMKAGSEEVNDPVKLLRIILRNIREEDRLRSEIYEFELKVKNGKYYMYAAAAVALIAGLFALI